LGEIFANRKKKPLGLKQVAKKKNDPSNFQLSYLFGYIFLLTIATYSRILPN
jgi:hypothetical protein